MIYIETQKLINGVVNKGGKVYIGKYGLDPLLPANKLTVYDKSETAITGFGLTLNFNSDVIVNGEAKGIYAKESYSIQFIDADGATYPKDFVNIVLPVDAEESGNWVKTLEPVSDNIAITNDDEGNYQIDTGGLVDADTSINWVKTLIPQTSNIQVTDDGEGNYTIDASALGGGDVFKSTDNTYDEGTTQNFDAATANTMIVGGVDVSNKNKYLKYISSEDLGFIPVSKTSTIGAFQALDFDIESGKFYQIILDCNVSGVNNADRLKIVLANGDAETINFSATVSLMKGTQIPDENARIYNYSFNDTSPTFSITYDQGDLLSASRSIINITASVSKTVSFSLSHSDSNNFDMLIAEYSVKEISSNEFSTISSLTAT